MTLNLNTIIRDLSEIYDKQSHDTFVTIYIDTLIDNKFIERREHACSSLLQGEEQENFTQTIQQIKEFLKKTKEKKLAIFASHKHNFFKYVPLPMDITNILVVDSSPYIRPLARIQDEWESFTLVLLDSHFAKIFSISLGEASLEKNLSKDIMNKHKKGGQSQARFQRLRKGAIHSFLAEVIEALDRIADKQIVIAGPGQAKVQFKEMLPKHLAERIIQLLDIDIHDEHALVEKSVSLISEREQQKSQKAVQHLKAEILKDGLAVYGIDETLQAVKNGQVELLLVEKDYKIKGCLCENCQIVRSGPIKDCPICGGSTTEADVIEEIIEFAKRTDADIEFTADEEITQLGHVGAILRYK